MNEDIVVTKWVALGATAGLIELKGGELEGWFPSSFMQKMKEIDLSVERELEIAEKYGTSWMAEMGEGGIFNRLWQMGEELGCGMSVEMPKIPIRQETIEICERYDINPYYAYSKGALLIVTPGGAGLVQDFEEAGIPAVIIGSTRKSNARTIKYWEHTRFLDRPQQEELVRAGLSDAIR